MSQTVTTTMQPPLAAGWLPSVIQSAYEVLLGIEHGYLRSHLFPIISAWQTGSSRLGVVQVPPLNLNLWDQGSVPFPLWPPPFGRGSSQR